MSQKMNQSIGPKGDVSYIRATPTGSLPSKSPPPVPGRDTNLTPLSQFSGMDFELTQREEMLSKELEEARIRASQMEKTMRWWSDCTSNWREKWNKARNERNKARDENRQLRSKIDAVVKECNLLKRQRQDLKVENENLKKHLNLPSDEDKDKVSEASSSEDNSSKTCDNATVSTDVCDIADVKRDVESELNIDEKNDDTIPERVEKCGGGPTVKEDVDGPESVAKDIQLELRMKLEHAQKTIANEKQERTSLVNSMEKLKIELASVKIKYDNLKSTKHESQDEINKFKDDQREIVGRITQELEDENSNRSSLETRLGELREELERLQEENSAEWAKRERLETEKLGLEREKKKLCNQVSDLEEQLQQKSQQASAVVDSDLKTMQFDLMEKNKELTDLRHVHVKLKKTVQDCVTELDHTKRRAEQYELEVKKLRGRIEELKKELAGAEDEVDSHANAVRKLQRANDDLQEQADNLQVQVEHLQIRLRRNSHPVSTGRPSSLKSYTFDDTGDADDSDLDDLP